jgi:Squalene-hopene cyclase C-terminal domain
MDQNLLSWLLEPESPSVRFKTMVYLLDLPQNHPDVREAQAAIACDSQVEKLFAAQKTGGYWVQPDYYIPKCYSTFWTLSILAEMGFTRENEHIRRGCDYLFTHQRLEGNFCRRRKAKQGLIWEENPVPCTHARIIRFLIQYGYGADPRTRKGLDWLLNTQRKDGMWLCLKSGEGCYPSTW